MEKILSSAWIFLMLSMNRPGFPGECFICELTTMLSVDASASE
ncbi:hypothetical protein B232_5286 [Escherichia coli Tx1686]|nr:hypothetical protein B232_5286 [Escherichia coli Tx1686]